MLLQVYIIGPFIFISCARNLRPLYMLLQVYIIGPIAFFKFATNKYTAKLIGGYSLLRQRLSVQL